MLSEAAFDGKLPPGFKFNIGMFAFGYPGPVHFEDVITRAVASTVPHTECDIVAVCSDLLPQRVSDFGEAASDKTAKTVLLAVVTAMLPVPSAVCSWQQIFDFKAELHDKQWGFRRWLHSLATKNLSESEVRDEIEWTLNEYTTAMEIHRMKASQSFVDVFVITPLEILENIAKFNWSKIAKGALSIQQRKIELFEAEMKAPGRECAYVFDARKTFAH